jgi:hypothetical protein
MVQVGKCNREKRLWRFLCPGRGTKTGGVKVKGKSKKAKVKRQRWLIVEGGKLTFDF